MASFSCVVCVVRQGQGSRDTHREALSGPMLCDVVLGQQEH